MSYLGSLLATSGTGRDKAENPAPAAVRSRLNPQGSSSSAQSSSNRPDTSVGVKRKAEDSLTGDSVKLQRAQTFTETKVKESRPSFAPPGRASTLNVSAKAPSNSLNGASSVAKPRPLQAPVAAAGPPAKGSFLELMARAKALQGTKLGQGKKIMHKATPNPREEPRDRKKDLDVKHRGKIAGKGLPVSRSGSEDRVRSGKSAVSGNVKKGGKVILEKPKRKPVEVSYKGTMRPNPSAQPAYRGTANLKASNSREQERDRYGRRYSDELDEDEEDYDSAASSDMEAGAWELDEEEDFSARNARAEDAAAKREEEEHKRQKLLRKQSAAPAPVRRRF